VYFRGAYTFIPIAEFTGVRFSGIKGYETVSVTGNRLPYAPEHLFTGSVGYSHPVGLDFFVEGVRVSEQYADDLNTYNSTPDGQRGHIPGNTTWNATLNYHVEQWNSTFFVTAKNLLDDTFIVDRSRGLIPNNPRLVQTGITYRF
jgi:Fe(3+) dicitrate transport protein